MYLDNNAPIYETLPIAVGGVVVLYLVYSLGVAVYNITLHPLANFPGPKLRGAFNYPDAFTLNSGKRDKYIRELHEKYGPVFRLSPCQLSFESDQAWKDIYGFRPGKKQLRKDPRFYMQTQHDGLPANLINANDLAHSQGRRLLANAFSDQALRGQEEILNVYFDLLISRLKEQVDGEGHGVVNMVGWYNWTTFDIIGDLSFGESFHALESRDYHPWIKNIFQSIKFGRFVVIGGIYPWVFTLMKLMTLVSPGVGSARRDNVNYVRHKAAARLDIDTDRKDFVNYILQAKEDRAMSREEMISNLRLLITAGSETTATLLSGVTYYLLRSPSKLARLQAEVRDAFSSPDAMNLISLAKLPYLQATLEEGLRMYPPVPTTLPRVTSADGDVIDGRVIPGNTVVGVHQLSANRSERNWADPESFVPERWLHGEDVPERYRSDKRDSMQPFSVGPRNCLGKNLAYNEMRAILGRIVWHFDLELLPESHDWSKQNSWVLWEKPELRVQLSHSKTAQAFEN